MNRETRLLKTTTSTLQKHSISRYISVLTSEVLIRHPSIERLADFESNPGCGRQEQVEDLIRLGRKDASKSLEQKARAVGARGIVGIRYQYSPIGETSVLIVATGTAVEFDPER